MLNTFPDTTAYQTGVPGGTPEEAAPRGPNLRLMCLLMAVALCTLFFAISDVLASEGSLRSSDLRAGAAKPGQKMDLPTLQVVAERMLTHEVAALGEPHVTVSAPDSRLDLAACDQPEAFLPPGARAQGRTTVGVRCTQPTRWVVYLQAQVQLMGPYLAAARPLAAGQTLAAGDLVVRTGDLADLPQGSLSNADAVLGRQLVMAVNTGQALKRDALKAVPVVLSGQPVRLRVLGHGFEVSGEGTAVATAGDGQPVQVRTARGNVVSGIARLGGVVEMRI